MQKFDTSCGLAKSQIGVIKFNIKNKALTKLPVLPEIVETKLFFQGRDAWVFSWNLKNQHVPIDSREKIKLEVVAKLKKEFHQYLEINRYHFSCSAQLTNDFYPPKISVAMRKLCV